MSLFTHRRPEHSMKRFYNWFHAYYGIIERSLGPSVQKVVDTVVAPLPEIGKKKACEYACGSGMLSLKIAPFFSQVSGRDASEGMLGRARQRAEQAHVRNVSFCEGNILAIDAGKEICDWAFVSFALHLFSPDDQTAILRNLYSSSREGVIIIDHSRRWNPLVAFVEWVEGSHYDRFIKMDFRAIAERIGVEYFDEKEIQSCRVMIFAKKDLQNVISR